MNSIVENELPGSQELRDQLMDIISDADLAYKLPGNNLTLGELCEEMAQTEQIYIQSYKIFKQDWSYRAAQPETANSVASLKVWFKKLDAEFVEVLSGFLEDDLQNKQVDRGYGFTPSLFVQFQIYHEALLIFYAKASIYLKALEKQLNDDWKIGIG